MFPLIFFIPALRSMVQVVTYGSLEAGARPLAPSQKRLAAARFAFVACAALATAAVVAYVSNGVPSVLYEGDPNPAHLSDDQVSILFSSQVSWLKRIYRRSKD